MVCLKGILPRVQERPWSSRGGRTGVKGSSGSGSPGGLSRAFWGRALTPRARVWCLLAHGRAEFGNSNNFLKLMVIRYGSAPTGNRRDFSRLGRFEAVRSRAARILGQKTAKILQQTSEKFHFVFCDVAVTSDRRTPSCQLVFRKVQLQERNFHCGTLERLGDLTSQ